MEELIIKNFGPIKEVNLNLNKVTVFIGEQGSGKSCIAKLLSVLRNEKVYVKNPNILEFSQTYNINSFFKENTFISYKSKNFDLVYENHAAIVHSHNTEEVTIYNSSVKELTNFIEETQKAIKELESDNNAKQKKVEKFTLELTDRFNTYQKLRNLLTKPSVYIPAERIFISSIAGSLYGLANSQVSLPKCLTEFGSLFENARKVVKTENVDFFKLTYNYENEKDTLSLEDKTTITLPEASSGIQAAMPMIIVIEFISANQDSKSTFVIEEPESNLYPVNQKFLTYFLLDKCTKSFNDLIITTHSPFVLRSFNIALQAFKTSEFNPAFDQRIEQILSRNSWLNPSEFNAYFLGDGVAKQIYNEATGQIVVSDLDDIVNQIDGDLDTLMGFVRGEGI